MANICPVPSCPLSRVASLRFKTRQYKIMRRAVYSLMGLPCHCHQSNTYQHITPNHYGNKDGLCMNMSGVPLDLYSLSRLVHLFLAMLAVWSQACQCRPVSPPLWYRLPLTISWINETFHSWFPEDEACWWCWLSLGSFPQAPQKVKMFTYPLEYLRVCLTDWFSHPRSIIDISSNHRSIKHRHTPQGTCWYCDQSWHAF